MSLLLFYDTETSDLPLWGTPSDDIAQPHILQIAASLVDSETRQCVASIDLLCMPDGWSISQEAYEVHGITHERATLCGIDEVDALDIFLHLWKKATVRIGHQESYDARIVRIGIKRFDFGPAIAEKFKEAPAACTCELAQPICKLPGKTGFKKPKLVEAYKYFFGTEFDNAHTARADVDATIAVYWAIQDYQPRSRGKRA